ncbi:hypothetical protein [Nocardia sp. NPDC057668]|uniref:hypothetical protein n=1 Tax=Nocardia sp. NPDC057668 TaxID=3346202 RepID=UPI00366D686B
MIRRLAAAALPLFLLAACADDQSPTRPAGFWFTAPRNDEIRLEALDRARAVDPCALVPRAELAKIAPIRSVENDDRDSCEAELGSAEANKGIELDWAVVFATVQEGAKSAKTTIAGTDVLLAGDKNNIPEDQFAKLVQRNCTATAQFPAGAALMLFVTTPLGTEPCDLGEKVLGTAIAEFLQEPARGTSPDTAATVLDATADPCDVLPQLGVTVNAADRRMRTCDFTYKGDEISLRYEYEERDTIPGHDGPPLDLGGNYPVYRDVSGDDPDDFHFYTAVIGPEINPATADPTFGPRVPTVSVTGKNDEVLTEVLRRTLTLFP